MTPFLCTFAGEHARRYSLNHAFAKKMTRFACIVSVIQPRRRKRESKSEGEMNSLVWNDYHGQLVVDDRDHCPPSTMMGFHFIKEKTITSYCKSAALFWFRFKRRCCTYGNCSALIFFCFTLARQLAAL